MARKSRSFTFKEYPVDSLATVKAVEQKAKDDKIRADLRKLYEKPKAGETKKVNVTKPTTPSVKKPEAKAPVRTQAQTRVSTPVQTKTSTPASTKSNTKTSTSTDYYDTYKKYGKVNLGGNYSVRKNAQGLIEYSN
ncbi:MAG: hypothetical protein RIR50_896, partial [Pseudomonadota bacterium]